MEAKHNPSGPTGAWETIPRVMVSKRAVLTTQTPGVCSAGDRTLPLVGAGLSGGAAVSHSGSVPALRHNDSLGVLNIPYGFCPKRPS